MLFATGQALSSYEILGSLRVGWMGEVGSTCDGWLERKVAINVLPEQMADDEETTDPADGCPREESRS